MVYIGNVEIKHKTVLAPMAGISNTSYRKIIKSILNLTFPMMIASILATANKTIDAFKSGVQLIHIFEYEWENKIHLYFPDFYLPDYDIYIEVKGYERERDRCKWKVVPNLLVLKKKEIE